MQVTINLPEGIFLRNVNGEAIKLDVTKLPADVVGKVFEVGAKTILTNVWNGGGKDQTSGLGPQDGRA